MDNHRTRPVVPHRRLDPLNGKVTKVTSGTPVDGTGTWHSSRDGRPTRVPDDQQTSTGEPRTTQDPSW
jgi:hypothetical protein